MVVYADILMLVNLIVDFALIELTARFLKVAPRFYRKLLGAAVGAIASLYIFLPQTNELINVLFQIGLSFIITLLAFGFHNFKFFLRAAAVFFGVTFLYGGAMLAFYMVFKPDGMVVNNSVVYFDISLKFLIIFSIIGYFLVAFIRFLLKKSAPAAPRCTVVFWVRERSVKLEAIIDTGNSLQDIFGFSQVIVAERKAVEALFPEGLYGDEVERRYRAIPCKTVMGTVLLDGYRCDTAKVFYEDKKLLLNSPILAVSKEKISDADAIINPDTIQ